MKGTGPQTRQHGKLSRLHEITLFTVTVTILVFAVGAMSIAWGNSMRLGMFMFLQVVQWHLVDELAYEMMGVESNKLASNTVKPVTNFLDVVIGFFS